MTRLFKGTALSVAAGIGLVGSASAAEILVMNDIAVDTVWTANNTYNLQNQIYVLPGASLTIEAGTVVASTPTANGSGSLAVTRGAQIFINGTKQDPVIMTSTADVATWTAGDPKTGVWREAANEWGNLTIMGRAYISEDAVGTNSQTCAAGNYGDMEGLTNGPMTDRYGGGNDDDDSGRINYCSLRYGGRVVGLTNELNGLSLGGIGRGTDIHHVEIMNNVDDGIEIWGGTVNLKYISIWNIGDDSFDIDQGWRGKAQFILIVQGYSLDADQGSGVGDNCFETDGAENSWYQPVTTATIYNATVIGQPVDGDGLTAWRDNARIQYRNCIFMDGGDELVRDDNIDGDGGAGYGAVGGVPPTATLSWAATWATPYNAVPAHPNDCPASVYQSQTSGNLAEIKDSVFYNNQGENDDGTAYAEAIAVGVLGPGGTPANDNLIATLSPIQNIVRAAPVLRGGKVMQRVTSLDPRPANDALPLSTIGFAPADGFFTQAKFRGAFWPEVDTWLSMWTASEAFGFTSSDKPCIGERYCEGSVVPNSTGLTAEMFVSGSTVDADDSLCLTALNLPQGNNIGYFIMGTGMNTFIPPGSAGPICVAPGLKRFLPPANMTTQLGGGFSREVGTQGIAHPVSVNIDAGETWNFQAWHRDGMNPSNLTDAVSVTFQ